MIQTPTQWNTTTQPWKKEWDFAICYNRDGLGGNYAKWNKSEKDISERQILYMWNLKNGTEEFIYRAAVEKQT